MTGLVCSKQHPRQPPKESGTIHWSFQPVRDHQIEYIGLLSPSERSQCLALHGYHVWPNPSFILSLCTPGCHYRIKEAECHVPSSTRPWARSHFKGHVLSARLGNRKCLRTEFPSRPYPAGARLVERKNGILKQQIYLWTAKPPLAKWIKVLLRFLIHLHDQPVEPVIPYVRPGTPAKAPNPINVPCPQLSLRINMLCCWEHWELSGLRKELYTGIFNGMFHWNVRVTSHP